MKFAKDFSEGNKDFGYFWRGYWIFELTRIGIDRYL